MSGTQGRSFLPETGGLTVFGTGFVAEMFWTALEKAGMEGRVRAFAVTRPEPDGRFHGLPVVAAEELDPLEAGTVCLAVHESLARELLPRLEARGFRGVIWVYPFLYRMLYGEPVRRGEPTAVRELLARQNPAYAWITVRYLAARDLPRGGEAAARAERIYLRAMSAHCSPETARRRLDALAELTRAMARDGFDPAHPILVDTRGRVIDGLHRLAAACALGLDTVICDVTEPSDVYDRLLTDANRLPGTALADLGLEDGDLDAAAGAKAELWALAAQGRPGPKISVILPVYNVGEYLDPCMRSLQAQTFADFEALLINDGSTDGSGERCARWARTDPRIRFVDKANEGVAATRNLGLELARGEYVAFIDPDDWVDPAYLEKLLRPLEETGAAFSECDLWRYDNRTGKKIYRACYGKMGVAFTLEEHMKYGPTATYKALSRRDLWIRNRVRMPDCSFESPAVYALILALAGRVESVREPLYYYRRFRENSLIETGYAAKDGTPDNTMGVGAMEYLIGQFRRCGLYERYAHTLEGVVKYRLSDILAMQFHRKPPEDFAELVRNMRAFLAEAFPLGRGDEYVTWGGYNLSRILTHMDWLHDPSCRFCFSSVEAVCGPEGTGDGPFRHRNRYREIMLERERLGSLWSLLEERRPAYFIMDLLEERFGLVRAGGRLWTASDAFEGAEARPFGEGERIAADGAERERLWRHAAEAFFARVREASPGIRFVLVENLLSQTVGGPDGRVPFADADGIRRVNDRLRSYYAFAETLCPDAVVIRPADDPLYYTDREYEYGAVPAHLNEIVNRRIAGMIVDALDAAEGK